MNNGLSRKYIVISLFAHLAIFLIMAYVIHSNRIAKPFVVFGAHSKKPSHAIMKFGKRRVGGRGGVPFVGGGRKGGKRAGRVKTRENSRRNSSRQVNHFADKAPKLRGKKLAPLAVKQKVDLPEKLIPMRSGVSIQKEKREDKRAKKLRQKKEQAARKRETKRLAREASELREMEKILAKRQEEAQALEQIRKLQAKKEAARKVKKIEPPAIEKKENLLVAQRDNDEPENHENADTKEISRVENTSGEKKLGDNQGGGQDEGILATNDGERGEEVLEFNLLEQSDAELRVYQKNIQQEVARLWHPPIGVPKGTTCRMMITLGSDGSVERAEFVSRSKMLIYDLSVLRIVKHLELDKFLWGKRFIIDFCQ